MKFVGVPLFRLLPVLCIQLASFLAIANPLYRTAFVGTNVTIYCSHPEHFYSADWVRPRFGNDPEKEMCLNGICLNGYARRFSVDRSNNFTLTIRNVTAKDSGKYVCIAYDDFTDHRYTTELNVIDRPAEADIAQSVTKTNALADFSTTPETQSQLNETSLAVVISSAVVVSICATIFILIVVAVAFRLRRRKREKPRLPSFAKQNTASDDHIAYEGKSSLDEIIEFEAKILQTKDDDTLQAYSKPEQVNVVEQFAVSRGARLLAISFLKRFREKYKGSNESVSAATSTTFCLLAKSSPLWLSKLTEKNAAKRRIRQLLYYECSGYISPPVRLDPIKPAAANNPMMAVAVLNGCVYTICKDSDTIIVGSSGSGGIRVAGMKNPVDIVACAMTQSLYIADEQRCIWRVSVSSGKAEKWREIRSELLPKSLSICNGSVLVTTDKHVLLKFSAGEGGKVINLPVNMEPHHAAETARNTYVVCCKVGRGVQVAEVGSDGRVIRKFVCVLQLLRNPSYVVLDGEGRPLVADSVNSKILLLDLKLKHSHTVLSRERDGIAAPHRLCLDESTGQLYVVQRPGHSVEVYRVKTLSQPLITL